MAFEGLTEKLSSAFKKLRNKGRLTESDVKEAMREIRLALLEADVSYKVVKDFIKAVTEKAVGTEVLESLTPAQAIVKIVNQELVSLMGGGSAKITIASQPPTVVMMVGLQGAGKTTNAAKLAGLMRKQNGKRPLLAACDIYRPAAIQQLEVVGKQLDIPVFQMGQENPVTIAEAAIAHAKKHGNDMVFLDTAGRLHVDEALMEELLITCPESEQAMVRSFSCFAADGDCIYLGNSMPVRYWNSFAQTSIPTENVRANRGANGIDGQISGFLGVSARCSRSWALVGDLTAMYDSNALALLPQLDRGTRVLGVINNGGGGIFRTLPGADGQPETMRKLLVQPHAHSFKAIAEQWGMRYLTIRTAEDFDQLDSLEENSQTLVELIPDREQTEQIRLRLANAQV